jgi:ATP-dependent protease ClpP protease subunit
MATLTKDNIEKWFEKNIDIDNRTLYMGSIDRYITGHETGVDYSMAEFFIKGMHVLENKNNNPITVIMNNPGGDFYHGMAIYDIIQNAKSHITVITNGHAMSMGSIILQAADTRIMMPNSRFMIHYGYSSQPESSPIHLKKWMEEDEKLMVLMEDIYIKPMLAKEEKEGSGYLAKTLNTILPNSKFIYSFSKIPKVKETELREVIKSMLEWDTILSAQETVDLGFADEIYKP